MPRKIVFNKQPLEEFSKSEIENEFEEFEKKYGTFEVVEEAEPTPLSTIEDCFNRFISYHKGKGSSDETIHSYTTSYHRMIRMFEDTIGKRPSYPVALLAHNQFEQWFRDWLKKQGLKEQTILTTFRTYRAFYYFCAEHDWVEKKKITIKNTDLPIKPLFTNEQLDKILGKPSSKDFLDVRNYTIVNLIYGIGARIGSITLLKCRDLDELNDGYIILQNTKNHKPQRVYIPFRTIQILKKYLNTYRSDAAPDEPVFCNQFGEFTTPNNMSACIRHYMIKRLGKEAPEHFCSAHCLRHQYAAEFVRNGGSIVDLKAQLGHQSLAMSLHYSNHYSRPNASEIEKFSPVNNRKQKTGRTKKF